MLFSLNHEALRRTVLVWLTARHGRNACRQSRVSVAILAFAQGRNQVMTYHACLSSTLLRLEEDGLVLLASWALLRDTRQLSRIDVSLNSETKHAHADEVRLCNSSQQDIYQVEEDSYDHEPCPPPPELLDCRRSC